MSARFSLALAGAAGLADTRLLYTALVLIVALERLLELSLSSRHARATLLRGGLEFGRGHYPAMVLLHALFLPACVLEVWLLERPFVPALGGACLVLFGLAQGLRYWALSTLGVRWSTRVVCVPGEPLITGGPYRWLRHPNYLAVVIELLCLPLVHTAWATALFFGAANAALLRVRIAVEEAALRQHCERNGVAQLSARSAPGAVDRARAAPARSALQGEP